jgi:hypothetical protein
MCFHPCCNLLSPINFYGKFSFLTTSLVWNFPIYAVPKFPGLKTVPSHVLRTFVIFLCIFLRLFISTISIW